MWTLDCCTDQSPAFNQQGTRRAPDRQMSRGGNQVLRWKDADLDCSWLFIWTCYGCSYCQGLLYCHPRTDTALTSKRISRILTDTTLTPHTFTLWFKTQASLQGLASSVSLIRPWGGQACVAPFPPSFWDTSASSKAGREDNPEIWGCAPLQLLWLDSEKSREDTHLHYRDTSGRLEWRIAFFR